MKRFFALSLACLALLLVATLEPAESQDEDEKSPADWAIDMYREGTMKAMYAVQLHDNPVAGQYWHTTMTMDALPDPMVMKWQVVKVTKDRAIIENDAGQGYVFAYEVDTGKDAEKIWTEGNVTGAWIGKPGEKAEKIQIMDVPELLEDDEIEMPESITEDFTESICGKKWTGKKTTMKKYESVVWIADNGWFGGMVRMTGPGGMKNELSARGNDGKAWLLWEDDKKTEATDPMAEWKKLHAPGKQHKLLAGLAGSWEMEIKMWFGGPDDPVVVKGSVEKKMTLGGRYLSTEYELKGSVMAHKGLEMIGHDNASGKFQLLQVTSIGTGMRVDTGVYDEAASTITFTSAPYTFEFGGQKMEVTTEHLLKIDSKDKHTVIQQTTYPKPMGTIKEVVIVYTRKK